MGLVREGDMGANSIMYFEFYPYWSSASFEVSQVRWIQPEFKLPTVTTLNDEEQLFYGFTSESNLAFMGT